MKNLKPRTNVVVNSNTGDKTYFDTRTGEPRKRWWTKARIPGMTRDSRKPGGSSHKTGMWEGGNKFDAWYHNGGW